ncbi:hypothetical protein [Pedobacter faecalis]|uniref:hypothetical protein n=1 Tax=Pedobacter faecalis TaxID=3041495 RepID=UPI00254F826D|nr:hypothetical protein [Pedobacter sp. ELA7]
MKKLLVICGLLFAVVASSQAQEGQRRGRMGGTPEERAKRQTEVLSERLKLSDEQKAKVNALYLEQGKKMVKLRDSLGDNREGFMGVMMKANEETNKKITAVLTDDQKKSFTALQEERREAIRKRQQENQR